MKEAIARRPGWNPSRQCTASNRGGQRCRRQPIAGGNVCILHGGAIPVVQEAAKRRLIAMREPIFDAWEEIIEMFHGTRCETCGRPTGDPAPVIAIGKLVLDRTGFHPSLTVEHVTAPDDSLDTCTEDELVEKLEVMLADAKRLRDAKEQLQLTDGAEDAVLVDQPAEGSNPEGVDTSEKWSDDK
jgi:hypothetical protein